MDILTKSEENFCENAGLGGLLLSITCVIQQLVFMIPHWITFTLMAVYILPITSFVLLMKKRAVAPIFILISMIFIFSMEVFLILTLTFSLVLLLLFLYLVAMVAYIYTGNLVSQLKRKERVEKEEAAKWNGIV